MRKNLIWLVLLLIAGMGLFAIFYPVFAVPSHISLAEEQKQQRETVTERVRLIGGWDALRRQCDELLKANNPADYGHRYGSGTALPSYFVPLRPRELLIYPQLNAPNQPPGAVEIKFYGGHRTGTYDIPYYAFWVWGSSTPATYTPNLEDYRNFGSRPSGLVVVEKLADGVYAVSSKQRRPN